MLMSAQPVLCDGNTTVLTKQAKGGVKYTGRTLNCMYELSLNELPDVAASAYQGLHVWSAS